MIDRKTIHTEAARQCGHGTKTVSFELGAEWVLSQILRINDLAKQAHETAVRRGEASEIDPSKHLPQYTASVEELADIAISALTELYARVDNVEEVIVAKINYNKTRV